MSGGAFDPRLTPARGDIAARALEGRVAAARYADGEAAWAVHGVVGLRRAPASDALLDTELLYGEAFTIYGRADGWAWGQAALDGYVGYVPEEGLAPGTISPTHRAAALRSLVFPAPDLKRPPVDALPLNARVAVRATDGDYAEIAGGRFVFTGHLVPESVRNPDYVAVAERFMGTAYLWGGRTVLGLDCSGLVQTALLAAGHAVPRDTDLQEQGIGVRLANDGSTPLRRGDLVFWPGHVGIMRDGVHLLHANATQMAVTVEPVADVAARIREAGGGEIRTVRRIGI